MPEQPAGRLSAGETGTETETDVSPQCLAAVADPRVDPLFTSRALEPRVGLPRYFIYRLAFPSPGLGVMPSSKPTPAVAQPGPGYRCQLLLFEKPRSLSLLGLSRSVPSLDPRSIRLAITDHYASSLHFITGPAGPSRLDVCGA